MHIKSIVAAATIALIAGVGSVSADENDVDGTAVNTGAPFALLDGIATEQMTVQELDATRGAGGDPTTVPTLVTVEGPLSPIFVRIYEGPPLLKCVLCPG